MTALDERKCFTFIWTVENISYDWHEGQEFLRSPSLMINAQHETTFYLDLHLNGYNYENSTKIFLMIEEVDILKEIDYELAFLSKNGEILNSKKEYNVNTSCAILSIDKNKVFAVNRSSHLPDDQLIVRCKIWVSDGEMTTDVQFFARTQICIKKEIFLWNIKNFSNLKSEEKSTYQIKSVSDNEVLMTLDLLLMNPFTDDDSINIQLAPKKVKIKYCVLRLMPLNGSRSSSQSIRKEILFSEDKKPKLLTLPFSKKDLVANKDLCLPNDVLSFRCECIYSTGDVIEEIESVIYDCEAAASTEPDNLCLLEENPLSVSKRILNDDLKSLFHDNILSDIKLKTDSKTFLAHKNILSARSPVFNAMFSNNMKEKCSNCVDIKDLDSDTVFRMLLYIYTAEIKDLQMENACDLYRAADLYQILSLRNECSAYIKSSLSPNKACEVLILADIHQDEDLKASVQEFIFNHDILNSEEWKSLMKTHLKLAADTMYLQVQKKLNFPGNKYSVIEHLFGNKSAKVNPVSSRFKSTSTKTTSTPVSDNKVVSQPNHPTFSFGNNSTNKRFEQNVAKREGGSTKTPSTFGVPTQQTSTSQKTGVSGALEKQKSFFATPAQQTNVFGAPAQQTTGLFGASTQQTTSVFGAPAQQTTKVFGAAAQQTTGLFGAPAQQTTGLFGAPAKQTTGLFGAPAQQTTGVFGAPAQQTTSVSVAPVSSPSSFSFSGNKTENAFGSVCTQGPFGRTASSGLNSNNLSIPFASKGFNFGTTEKSSTSSFFFDNSGQKTPVKSSFSFGNSNEKEPIKPLFCLGHSSEKQERKIVKSSFSFGNNSKKETVKPLFLFGKSSEKLSVEPAFSFVNTSENESAKLSSSFGSSDSKESVKSSFSFGKTSEKEPAKLPSAFGSSDKKESVKSSFSFGKASEKEPAECSSSIDSSNETEPAEKSFDNSDEKGLVKSISFGTCSEKETEKPSFPSGMSSQKEPVKPSFASCNEKEPDEKPFADCDKKESIKESLSLDSSDEKEPVKQICSFASGGEKKSHEESSSFASSGEKESVKTISMVNVNEEEPVKPSFTFACNDEKEQVKPLFLFSSPCAEASSPSPLFNSGTEQAHLNSSSALTKPVADGSGSSEAHSTHSVFNDCKATTSFTSLGPENTNRDSTSASGNTNSVVETAPSAKSSGIANIIGAKPSEPLFSFVSTGVKAPSSLSGFNSNNEATHSACPTSDSSSAEALSGFSNSSPNTLSDIDSSNLGKLSTSIRCDNNSPNTPQISETDSVSSKIQSVPSKLDCASAETSSASAGLDIISTKTPESSGFDSSSTTTPPLSELDSRNRSTLSASPAFDSSSKDTTVCSGFNSADLDTERNNEETSECKHS